MSCEYRFLCGEKDCGRNLEECRKLLVEKLTERESAMKRQRESFAQELAAVKESEGERRVFFLCDRRACESCDDAGCRYTLDVRHAASFHLSGTDFLEKE